MVNGQELMRAGDPAGQVARREFGAQEMAVRGETAATAVAAREAAAVQARFIMAERNPRSIEAFRVAMLDECKRPAFAAVARYAKPIGTGKVYGPTIRFIEAAIRNFRNLAPEVFTVFDSERLRIVRVTVTDLESNICYATEIQVEKTVERKNGKGREILAERTNSYNEPVFIVMATEDEVNVKQAALVSKAIRTQAQRLLPGDVVEECMATIIAIQAKADAQDPAAALRKIVDSFHELNVEPADLEKYLGKPLDRLQPKNLQDLREIYAAIKDGQISWDEIAEPLTEGSREAMKQVAQDKIAALRGSKPTTAAATPAATKEAEPPQVNSADALPIHHQNVLAYREAIGGEAWMRILGSNGKEGVADVAEGEATVILAEMEEALVERRAAAAQQTAEAGSKPNRFARGSK